MKLNWYEEECALQVYLSLYLNELPLLLTHHVTELLYIFEYTFDIITEEVALFMHIIYFKTIGNSNILSPHKLPQFIEIYVTTSSDGIIFSNLRN